MPCGAWERSVYTRQKALPRDDHSCSSKRAGRVRSHCSRNWEQKRTETCKPSSPTSEASQVSLLLDVREKSLRKHGAFGDIPVTQKRSLIQFDRYSYAYFRSLGPLSRLLEVLFFTWGMYLRCCRKILPPLVCGIRGLHSTIWESSSPTRSCWICPHGQVKVSNQRRLGEAPLTINNARANLSWHMCCSAHQSQVYLGGWYWSFFLAFPGNIPADLQGQG